MKKRICFIVNPISGVGRQKVVEKLISKDLDKSVYDYEIVYTKAAKHATTLARAAAEAGVDVVVAVGGDGSVNETAKGLVGTTTAMAILPCGSGNGLARHLKIPLNLRAAMKVINAGLRGKMDTVSMNEETFVNVGGVGFDAHIGWEFARFGKRGLSSYLRVIAREFPSYKAQNFELVIDGKTIKRNAYLISFANGSQWGNNAWIAPLADVSDGVMDIAILRDFRFFGGLWIAYKLFRKSLHNSSYLEVVRASEVIIRQDTCIAHIDGEPVEPGTELRIKVNTLSLNIIIPAKNG
jgi:YegS/Rv2252/BmrU family lipid kinase